MSTHCNFAVIEPGEHYHRVFIVRGVKQSGNARIVTLEMIGEAPTIDAAIAVCRGAPFIDRLDFLSYSEPL